jgi:hypothetical protein
MNRELVQFALCLLVAGGIGCHRASTPLPQGSSLAVTISTNTIRIGDPLHLRLTSIHTTNLHLRPPELAQDKKVIVRNRREFAEPLPDGRVREVVDYAITSLVTGSHIVASSPGLVWVRPDGTTTQAPFPFVAFKVQSTLTSTNADLSQLRDLHELARWPDRFPRWLVALLISVVAVGLGAWLLRLYLARVRKLAAQAPQIPPHEAALLALRNLRAKPWIKEENYRAFYWELTDILRNYVEKRFGLHAPEQTTEEFLAEATKSKLLHYRTQNQLFAILDFADRVKFAKYLPKQDDMRAALDTAETLVRETIPAAPEHRLATQPANPPSRITDHSK